MQHRFYTGADPGFLERGFLCIKMCGGGGGGSFADFISLFLNIL